MSYAAFLFCLAVSIGIFVFTLDDLFIDCVAFLGRLRPQKISTAELRRLRALPEKRIAILVANWHEEEILEPMVRGNLSAIDYTNYSFFLGVYPNDMATWEAARRLEAKHPNVFVVVNSLPGPTSKGQLLNEMVRQVLKSEPITGLRHDLFLLHDSEDVIHPLSFLLLNAESDRADFVQIPVFSLPVAKKKLVAGVYADEFAEAHTKDMLVRSALGAPVPSAGVGTALSRKLVLALTTVEGGNLLNENCLTEDYQLGLLSARLGFRTAFSCRYVQGPSGKDFIATREYFPEAVGASVRQKTRWTVGIAFQSKRRFGWSGSLLERYFLWRDRRGPWNGLLLLGSAVVALLIGGHYIAAGELPRFAGGSFLLEGLALTNLMQMLVRLLQRMRATAYVYGFGLALLVPLRWPVGNFINTLAAWRAYRVDRAALRSGTRPAWVKTEHKLPEHFGRQKLEIEREIRA